LELRHACGALLIVSRNAHFLQAAAAANARDDQTARIRRIGKGIIQRLSAVPAAPVIEDTGATTLAGQLLLSGSEQLSPEELAARILERADVTAGEILGELCAHIANPPSTIDPAV